MIHFNKIDRIVIVKGDVAAAEPVCHEKFELASLTN